MRLEKKVHAAIHRHSEKAGIKLRETDIAEEFERLMQAGELEDATLDLHRVMSGQSLVAFATYMKYVATVNLLRSLKGYRVTSLIIGVLTTIFSLWVISEKGITDTRILCASILINSLIMASGMVFEFFTLWSLHTKGLDVEIRLKSVYHLQQPLGEFLAYNYQATLDAQTRESNMTLLRLWGKQLDYLADVDDYIDIIPDQLKHELGNPDYACAYSGAMQVGGFYIVEYVDVSGKKMFAFFTDRTPKEGNCYHYAPDKIFSSVCKRYNDGEKPTCNLDCRHCEYCVDLTLIDNIDDLLNDAESLQLITENDDGAIECLEGTAENIAKFMGQDVTTDIVETNSEHEDVVTEQREDIEDTVNDTTAKD